MKHKRQKQAQKVMLFYEKHFSMKPPYNIMVDGPFVKAALKNKVNIWDQLPRYLGAEVKLFTTTCVLRELETFGKLFYGPWKVMKEYRHAPCPHKDHGVQPDDCLRKMVRRSHPEYLTPKGSKPKEKKNKPLKFLIATEHDELKKKIQRTPGVPLLYLHGNAILLADISEASKEAAGTIRQSHLVPAGERSIKALFEKEGLTLEEEGPIHHKKKLKGPNPLSVLKKRRGLAPLTRREKINERRKWRRVRKRKGGELSALESLMMRELVKEDVLGWKGMVYERKTLRQLEKELAPSVEA